MRRYPGHFAPASLKPSPVSASPRSVRTARYPGHFAPASLKRDAPGELDHQEIGYPGHFAPASLKRVRDFEGLHVVDGYPGHFAPASLKLAVRRDSLDGQQVIRGISPRPH